MPKRLQVYLDTSVPNAFFDSKNQERQMSTMRFWKKKDLYEFFVSDLVLEEIGETGNESKRAQLLDLVRDFTVLSSREAEIDRLSKEYVKQGIIPVNHIEDAVHIAIASFYSMDVLVSWNFEHIVKLKTKRGVNVINVLRGYKELEIVEPTML